MAQGLAPEGRTTIHDLYRGHQIPGRWLQIDVRLCETTGQVAIDAVTYREDAEVQVIDRVCMAFGPFDTQRQVEGEADLIFRRQLRYILSGMFS